MEENRTNKIELDLETYEKMISENASMKKELEYFKQPDNSHIIVSNSHTPPVEEITEKPVKKGIFNFE